MQIVNITNRVLNRYTEPTLKRFLDLDSPWVKIHFYVVLGSMTQVTHLQVEIGNRDIRRYPITTLPKDLDEAAIVTYVIDWICHLNVWNKSLLTKLSLQDLQVTQHGAFSDWQIFINENYGNSKFARTGITMEIVNKFPRGPAFAADTFTEKAIGQIINYPEIKCLNDYFQGKAPIRSWVRVNRLETMIITKLDYVYELSESLFMIVTVDHSRVLLDKAELIALFSRTNLTGIK